MNLKKFKNLELKTNELSLIWGASSTTLIKEVGYADDDDDDSQRAESEYEDTNGNCEFDEGDRYVGTFYYEE